MRISLWSPIGGSAVFAHPGGAALIGISGQVAAMKRHAFICVTQAAGIVIWLCLFGPGSVATAAELTPFRVGEAAPANTFLAIWMAEVAGFYQAQGLQLEVVRMVGGSESGPALKAGRIHLMHIGMASVGRAQPSGGA